MIYQELFTVFQGAIVIAAGAWAFNQIKQLFINGSASVGTGLEGETLNQTVNLMVWDSAKRRKKKLDLLQRLGEHRRKVQFEEHQSLLAEGLKKKQKENKLKTVG